MPELGPYGSVRGARGNSRPYRESGRQRVETALLTHLGHQPMQLRARAEEKGRPADPARRSQMSLLPHADTGSFREVPP